MENIIKEILNAKSSYELFPTEDSIKEYRRLAKVHPDICKLPQAEEAFLRLQNLHDLHKNGSSFESDLGKVTYFQNGKIIIKGNPSILKINLDNYNKVIKSYPEIINYTVKNMTLKDDTLTCNVYTYIRLGTELYWPQVHINWLISRLLEFNGYLEIVNKYFNGLNPKTLMVLPKTHGIAMFNFIHLTEIPNAPKTAPGEFINWYKNKASTRLLNLELVAKTIIYLLGDNTGIGNKLKLDKNINKDILNFLLNIKDNKITITYFEYKELLNSIYEKKFHPFNV